MESGRIALNSYKTVIKIVTVNIAILSILIVLVELCFGNWLGKKNINHLNIYKNFTYKYKQALYKGNPNIIYKKDKYGFRGNYKNIKDIDILTVGGSTTDQRFITEGKTWQNVLSRLLSSRGQYTSVVNAGVNGQSTIGHIKNFQIWFPQIKDFNPKYFLFYLGINDFYVDQQSPFDNLEQQNLTQIIKSNSISYYLFRTLRGIILAHFVYKVTHKKINFTKMKWTKIPLIKSKKAYQKVMKTRLHNYQRRLRILFTLVKQHYQSKIILVTQKYNYYNKINGEIHGLDKVRFFDGIKYNGVDQYYLMRLLNKAAIEICNEFNGICIDFAEDIKLNHDDFYDFAHNTPIGADKIGRYLYEELKEKIIVSPPINLKSR